MKWLAINCRAILASLALSGCGLAVAGGAAAQAAPPRDEEFENLEQDALTTEDDFPSSRRLGEELPTGRENASSSEFLDPDAADFDRWDPIVEEGKSVYGEEHELRPFDWMRNWGFRHSSTDGSFIDKNVPLAHSSWLNRPYHIDWFIGPMLSDNLDGARVSQSNDLFGGLRAGWDFDYYWGIEWRAGWANPDVLVDGTSDTLEGDYFVSDVNFVYYPWGDTKVRPYFQWGLGVTQVDTMREDLTHQQATLLGMPMGVGVQFTQTPWLAWRLEIVDNLAFGGDGVDTMNNFAFTGGMEVRLGAKPNSYWPWRSSRNIW